MKYLCYEQKITINRKVKINMEREVVCPRCGKKVYLIECRFTDMRRAMRCENEAFFAKLGCDCGWKDEVTIRYSLSGGAFNCRAVNRYDLSEGNVMYAEQIRYGSMRENIPRLAVSVEDTTADIEMFRGMNKDKECISYPDKFKDIFNLNNPRRAGFLIVVGQEGKWRNLCYPWRRITIEDGFLVVEEPDYTVLVNPGVLATRDLLEELRSELFTARIPYDADIQDLGRVQAMTRELITLLKKY